MIEQPDATHVIGRRVVAALIDIIAMFFLFLALALALGPTVMSSYSYDRYGGSYVSTGFYVGLEGGAFLLYVGLVLLYFFVFEMSSGQTLGKRMLKLRVAHLDGTPAQPAAIAIRTLLRFVDWLPLFNLVGFVCVLATRRRQRVGDLLAKTVVVRQYPQRP